mmetsp:Transcript_28430/g.28741  ORF Transcript_28430/g.28741 Transcript_28430/m.28741 type:complete len:335 (+) Transcript_28430:47-1051(+)
MDFMNEQKSTHVPDELNPVYQVKRSCEMVASTGNLVSIDDESVRNLANEFSKLDISVIRDGVAWDACGWHYTKDKDSGYRTCQYIFVLDALNFCFWPTEGMEYVYLASSLTKILEQDETAFDATRLMSITEMELQGWLSEYTVPLLTERVLRLRELGTALLQEYEGLAINMVKAAGRSAVKLTQLILSHLPGFRDTAIYNGSLIHFYKRAQILVGDLWAAYDRPREGNIFAFYDISCLTMFADYRVPQLLRALEVLQYSSSLCEIIDTKQEIMFGSKEEIEIRACTIIAVERLHKELIKLGGNMLVIELDWLLWQKGEAIKDTLAPCHRTRTIY